jgi:hypothetical protein
MRVKCILFQWENDSLKEKVEYTVYIGAYHLYIHSYLWLGIKKRDRKGGKEQKDYFIAILFK